MTVKTPLAEAALGLFILIAAVGVLAIAVQRGSAEAMATGILMCVLFGGTAAWIFVIAIARARWARAYKRVHGYSPFARQ
ncbi:hypothetical protein [Microbacterium sp. P04]